VIATAAGIRLPRSNSLGRFCEIRAEKSLDPDQRKKLVRRQYKKAVLDDAR
jgi:hypothetical protein